ncbi:MAG: hypothetical protein JST54_27900 [Deltaproteobacteria bacterium]|nr:hypothetical protein [Deltaproteobacteria bacterium]
MPHKPSTKTRRRRSSPAFASIFPKAGHFSTKAGVPAWRVRGSGVNGSPLEAPNTARIAELLASSGLQVTPTCIMGMCCADQYNLDVEFLDGGLQAVTGNYLFNEKGAWVFGARAVLYVALRMGLRVPDAFRLEHGLVGVDLGELEAALPRRQAASQDAEPGQTNDA